LDRVRRIALTLINAHPDKFSADYQKNKQAVQELVSFHSKQLRNEVVGFITHYMKLQAKGQEVAEAESEQAVESPAEAAPAESGS